MTRGSVRLEEGRETICSYALLVSWTAADMWWSQVALTPISHSSTKLSAFGASAEHATLAGASYISRGAHDDEATPREADVLRTLEEVGWNNSERTLLPHQRHGLLHALTAINAANFSVPGAGKTATALAVIGTHFAQEHIDAVLVVGPLSCFRPWEREAEAALPDVLDVRRVRNLPRQGRVDIYRRLRRGDLLLLSFATAASDRHELEQLCRRLQIMLVVDESHRVKRFRGGQWAPALVEVARYARVKLILTGTPMPQGPNDLWSQFNILGRGRRRLARVSRTPPELTPTLSP